MKNEKIISLCIFNISIVVLNFVVFSSKLLGFSLFSSNIFVAALSGTIIMMSVLLCAYGNYKIIKKPAHGLAYVMDELDTPKEFVEALESYENRMVFTEVIQEVKKQIDTLLRKKKTLNVVLYQKFQNKASDFDSLIQVTEDTGKLLYDNIKKILSRMEIFDYAGYSMFKKDTIRTEVENAKYQIFVDHIAYINYYKQRNEEILIQFDRLLIEVSRLGDQDDSGDLNNLQDIIKAMRNLNTNESAEMSILEKKYQ